MITSPVLLHTLCLIGVSQALCGASIRWSHQVDINHVYGMWYGVGYAQHTPDRINTPRDIGCVTLYVSDADNFDHNWRRWRLPHGDYGQDKLVSYKINPWSDTPRSWLDTLNRLRRNVKRNISNNEIHSEQNGTRRLKRDMYGERRLKVIWDEDGESMEQTYVYTIDDPGLWTVQKWRPMEREMMSYGVDIWYPDNPPRYPEVIRILKVTASQLIINYCADTAGGGIFSLILRRSPEKVGYWQWYELQKQLYNFELPNVYRKAPVCAACVPVFSVFLFLFYGMILKFF